MQAFSSTDQCLQQAVQSGAVQGVVAAVTDRSGLLYQGAFGARLVGRDTPMALDSVFWIASMTKAITSVGALMLVEQGRLGLETPIGEVVPELASPQVLEGFAPDGTPRLRPARVPITLRHLLTHTAGFSYDFVSADLARYMKQEGLPSVTTGKKAALRLPLLFDPGESWGYGINTDWVGQAIERVSGQRLDAFLREHVLTPLGMGNTVFVLREDQRPRVVRMHQRMPDGSLLAVPFELPDAPEIFLGGGGLYSTAPDYAALLRMLLADGGGLLRPETVTELSRNQIGSLRAGYIPTANPQLTSVADFYPGMDSKWSLAFLLNPEPGPFGRSPGCLTWAGLPNTYFWIDPSRGFAAVILMQILPAGDSRAVETLAGFERSLYPTA